MRKRVKKEISVSISFVDIKGNVVGTDPYEVLSKIPKEQLNRNLSILLEATTGVKHKPGK